MTSIAPVSLNNIETRWQNVSCCSVHTGAAYLLDPPGRAHRWQFTARVIWLMCPSATPCSTCVTHQEGATGGAIQNTSDHFVNMLSRVERRLYNNSWGSSPHLWSYDIARNLNRDLLNFLGYRLSWTRRTCPPAKFNFHPLEVVFRHETHK